MSELKCCPFCGGEAKIATYDWGYSVKEYWCYCSSCGCETQKYHSKEDAIVQWNERKPMSNIVEKLEEEYVDCQKNMNLVKDEDGNEAGHIYDEYLNKSIAYETAINIVKQEINNGLE